MPWFKVDDGFHCHPKVLRAGNEAVGLYVRCGSYAAQQLTDGFIPEHIALLYGGDSLADALVRVGLWRRARGGWRMPDYLDYNPSKKQVLAEREKTRERVRKHREGRQPKQARDQSGATSRHSRDHVNDDSRNGFLPVDNSNPESVDPEFANESAGQPGLRNTVTNGVSNGVGTAAPSRPVQSPKGTRTDTGSQSVLRRNSRGSGDDDDSIDLATVELLAELTGREVSVLWAARVRAGILDGRTVKNRLAYLTKAIRERPQDFLPPVDSDAGGRSPLRAAPEWCGYCNPMTRLIELADDTAARCQQCHPLAWRSA